MMRASMERGLGSVSFNRICFDDECGLLKLNAESEDDRLCSQPLARKSHKCKQQ